MDNILEDSMTQIRYRRNINCLSENQLHDLREALTVLYQLPATDSHSYLQIAGLHGSPSPSYCRHGSPGFLTWHRAYILVFEKALQCINSKINLPFWDWSSGPTTGVPNACSQPTYVNRAGDTVANPLFSGPLPDSTQTSRRPDINSTNFNDLASTAQTVLTNTSFSSFQSSLNSVHGSVHVRVGGNMGSVPFSAYDPIFYLHHCNVDRLWAKWQINNTISLPSDEANYELDPFNKPFSTEWHIGSEYESTTAIGYKYTNFCFIIPPIIIWKPIFLEPIPFATIKRISAARLVIHSERMQEQSMEILVFVNQPEATEKSKIIENPNFAGSFGVFGMGGEKAKGLKMVDHQQSFDLELDITETLKKISNEDEQINLKLVAVDINGNPVQSDQIDIKGIELLIE